ncbi:MAG: hypothetical protein IJ202_05100 [Bacteroidales bacterium]|nr:hypothetical protein [Bacteroidales bacterium]
MEHFKLGIDKVRRNELTSSTLAACTVLNGFIFPMVKELSFSVDHQDKSLLSIYVKKPLSLKEDYINESSISDRPVMEKVLRKAAGELWNMALKASGAERVNLSIVDGIDADVMEYVSLAAVDSRGVHARPDNVAIEKACIIYADESDLEKKKELEELCVHLNRVFNGNGGLLSSYVSLEKGKFVPIRDVVNYKPLM